jgi:hypothetical protein
VNDTIFIDDEIDMEPWLDDTVEAFQAAIYRSEWRIGFLRGQLRQATAEHERARENNDHLVRMRAIERLPAEVGRDLNIASVAMGVQFAGNFDTFDAELRQVIDYNAVPAPIHGWALRQLQREVDKLQRDVQHEELELRRLRQRLQQQPQLPQRVLAMTDDLDERIEIFAHRLHVHLHETGITTVDPPANTPPRTGRGDSPTSQGVEENPGPGGNNNNNDRRRARSDDADDSDEHEDNVRPLNHLEALRSRLSMLARCMIILEQAIDNLEAQVRTRRAHVRRIAQLLLQQVLGFAAGAGNVPERPPEPLHDPHDAYLRLLQRELADRRQEQDATLRMIEDTRTRLAELEAVENQLQQQAADAEIVDELWDQFAGRDDLRDLLRFHPGAPLNGRLSTPST